MAMFHFIPVASHFYSPSHLSDPRDRYFAALAAAQAAEVDYLAAEAARREEDDLCRRLAEIQYRKQEQVLHDHLAPYTYPHIYPSYDRLILRQQLEEEELRHFFALKGAELEKHRRREQVVMELEAARVRRAREEALYLRQKEKASFQALLGQSAKVAEHPCFCAYQTSPPYCCHKYREHASSTLYPSQWVLPRSEPKVIAPVEPMPRAMQEDDGIEALLKQILGLTLTTSKPNASASMLTSKPSASVSEPRKAQGKGISDLQNYFEHHSEPNGLFLDQLRQPASQTIPVPFKSFEHLLSQEFSKLLVPPVVEETAEQASASSCSSRPAKDVAEQVAPNASASVSAAPNVPSNTPAQSLKEQLEARLNDEFYSEVRDTIQAIFESLRDTDNHRLSTSASSFSKATSSNSKGKAKVESTTTTSAPPSNPTSKNVVDSLYEIRSIEAGFNALQADFSFPETLDFISSHLTPGNPVTSDSESSSSTTHLAYTSRNHPVRFYEQALSAFLAQLDSVDSFGNDDLRATRKEVVSRVEKALEELEREVEGRYRIRLAKEAKSLPIETTTAPEVSTTITSANSDWQELPPAPEPMTEDPKETTFTPSVSIEPVPALTSKSSLETSEISELLTHQPKPATPISIPTITDALSLSLSSATVNGSEVQAEDTAQVPASPSVQNEFPDAFLLTTESEVIPKRLNNKDGDDVVSDWSEVEA